MHLLSDSGQHLGRSSAEVVEQVLLVAYPVINICGIIKPYVDQNL